MAQPPDPTAVCMRLLGSFRVFVGSRTVEESGWRLNPDWQPLLAFRLDVVRISGRFVYPSPTARSGHKLSLWEQPRGLGR